MELERIGEAVDGCLPSLGMGEQGGNVIEEDTRLREIRYRPEVRNEIHGLSWANRWLLKWRSLRHNRFPCSWEGLVRRRINAV